ncbi:MAG: glutamate synthase large subunit [Candidatus Omnitrophica bacterium]|nr:glutamate synthase large subunit [Candidatus Omnitrophota bacterium]
MRSLGLYHPSFEHDSCGVGFVASINGTPSHQIVSWAIQCVCNVTHRGALSADAKTGDGAGVLTQIPQPFFAKVLRGLNAPAVAPNDLAVGMLFLSGDPGRCRQAQGIVDELAKASGLTVLGWRDVPTDPSVLGEKAKVSLPTIRQILIKRPQAVAAEAFERTLMLVRRRIEKRFVQQQLEDCYIPSFSSRVLVYKGLLVAPQLAQFYPDLRDPDFTSSLAVFHQRYSTNTFPNWFLAQPFRYLGHNGEINTLRGNRNWMAAREPELRSRVWGEQLQELWPIVQEGGSDSMSLDNVLELLALSGRDLLQAMMMLVPDAWQNMPEMDPELKACYQYHALLAEPWDGPAALAFSDGTVVGACLDRNGLRPARYWVTKDGIVIMASEVGVVDIQPSQITEKGRIGPGHMIAVDTAAKQLLKNEQIKRRYASAKPYAQWLKQSIVPLQQFVNGFAVDGQVGIDPTELLGLQVAFGYTDEEWRMIIEPMAKSGKEPIFSMGDDAPLSVLSEKPKPLATYFKQLFAQVTNPPIDPIREELVMSLNTLLGERPNMLEEGLARRTMLIAEGPLLLPHEFEAVRKASVGDIKTAVIPLLFPASEGPAALRRAVKRIWKEAAQAVEQGATILILSDQGVNAERAAIPSLLATAAVHHHLIRAGRRMRASLVIEAGDVHEVHHFACLIGYGAAAVCPYLAYRIIRAQAASGRLDGVSYEEALAHYKKSMHQGLLKIMSKMGISTVGSYRGAQIFEAIGLSDELVEACFPGTPSRVGGITYEHLAEELLAGHRKAFAEQRGALEAGGFYQYRRDGEYHAFNPEMVRNLQQSIKLGDHDTYKKFVEVVESRPPTALRDLLDVKPIGPPVPIEEVEPVEAICHRFATASISYGALSLEAHETIAIALNRLGAKSGSGEGGEDPARYHPTDPNMNRSSAIKQIASGRFGVTPEYIMSARELEIKMAQGSKPGEGGQLPGHKVSDDIARVRHTIPGISLISPPPHHDIYSIEDLAQLIYDLKMINPNARVGVKLVAEAGVGTIAAGVAKAHADTILISGHDGGTGASPLSSIKHAGLPWELGLSEAQQTLQLNGLREKVVLRADGGMKIGRDVLIAALFGAEEYGFGTSVVVATGCVMTRKCHLNTCPVGVATQDPKLRAKFTGTPEMVVNYLVFLAEEVRKRLAAMGARALNEIIGRTDLLTLRQRPELPPKARTIELDRLLECVDAGPRYHLLDRNDWEGDQPLDDAILKDVAQAIERQTPARQRYAIRNIHRTVGARVAGVIATRYGDKGLPSGTIDLTFTGTAGQSFGAFCINGMRSALIGEANDYVGKGMAGGELIIRPPDEASFVWSENVIMGNTCLYGATGGFLYAAGRAGERFAVRNSGAYAVIEGLGDHGCEYMTGGIVVVLGPTGRNFGAGMTGGRAYVLDETGVFDKRVNRELVQVEAIETTEDVEILRTLIERHYASTTSPLALTILTTWDTYQPKFRMVVPLGAGAKLEQVVVAKEG